MTDAELQQFFVAPGYYGTDIAQMRDYEKGRAEFRKIMVRMHDMGGPGLAWGWAEIVEMNDGEGGDGKESTMLGVMAAGCGREHRLSIHPCPSLTCQ